MNLFIYAEIAAVLFIGSVFAHTYSAYIGILWNSLFVKNKRHEGFDVCVDLHKSAIKIPIGK